MISFDKEMKSSPIPNELFLMEVHRQLIKKKYVCIYVQGESMRPFLNNGTKVLLSSVSTKVVKRGSIVLARTLEHGIVLHRIVGIRGTCIILAGDANVVQREQTSLQDILGVVVRIYKRGKGVDADSLPMRLGAFLWYAIGPLRGYLLSVYALCK